MYSTVGNHLWNDNHGHIPRGKQVIGHMVDPVAIALLNSAFKYLCLQLDIRASLHLSQRSLFISLEMVNREIRN